MVKWIGHSHVVSRHDLLIHRTLVGFDSRPRY
nr:MAG TPA: hypothetical protein [Caudoviricetes sp.]